MQAGIVDVVMINGAGTGVTKDEMEACAAALTIQACEHFALPPPHGYGIGARVRVGSGPFDIKPNEWVIALLKNPTVPGALGAHWQTTHGRPIAQVFTDMTAADGVGWSTVVSHELLEFLADPNVARCVQSWDGRLYALEVADAVEATSYTVHGVSLSNFVLPPYFEPVANRSGLKLDWMGLIKEPLEILEGGYLSVIDWKAGGWVNIFNQDKQPRAYRMNVHGRTKRRRLDWAQKQVDQAQSVGEVTT